MNRLRSGLWPLVVRWWPALAGLPLGIVLLVDLELWRLSEPAMVVLPLLALVYLLLGARPQD